MLCLMFEAETRGVLATGNVPWPDDDIANAVGGDMVLVQAAIQELLAKNVARRNKAGAIFSRRLVRDERTRQERATAGQKGGLASKTQANSQANSKQIPESESEYVLTNGSSKKKIRRKYVDDAFNKFWTHYPRKVCKPTARKAFEKAIEKVDPIELLNAAAEFAESDVGKSGKFCPHASTWLNQERWTDDRADWKLDDGAEAKARAEYEKMIGD